MNLPTHSCRNRVYRQGIVKRCNRPTFWNHCESCTTALEEQRARLLGLSEAKKSPPNKPEELEVEDSFEVHDEDYEEKKEPGKKNNPRNDLDKGPKGEQGSKKSPYLKESHSLREAKKKKKCGRCDLGLEWSEAEEYGLCEICQEDL